MTGSSQKQEASIGHSPCRLLSVASVAQSMTTTDSMGSTYVTPHRMRPIQCHCRVSGHLVKSASLTPYEFIALWANRTLWVRDRISLVLGEECWQEEKPRHTVEDGLVEAF